MSRLAYLDCFAGVCGSMILGALVDVGLAPDDLRNALLDVPLRDYELTFEKATHNSIVGTLAKVRFEETHPHRTLSDIEAMIGSSSLGPGIQKRVQAVFRRLGQAEARVHGVDVAQVHFHEVGAVDAIVDITGAVLGLQLLGIDRLSASPVPTGGGFVRTLHGLLPVPAPAVAELLKRVPSYAGQERAELTTPTGAALLAELCDSFGPRPAMEIESVGYGAGEHRLEIPNFLRLFVGCEQGPPRGDADQSGGVPVETVWVLETLVDDATPELVAEAQRRLLACGALDAVVIPAIGKKGRAAVLFSALASTEIDCVRLARLLFAELPTLGIRFREEQRFALARSSRTVVVRGAVVRLKVGRLPDGSVVTVAPEFEDCRAVSEATGSSLRSVYEEALELYRAGASEIVP